MSSLLGSITIALLLGAAPSAPDPRVDDIEALLEGRLAPQVDPRSLFDVALDDEAAIRVEAARLRALLHAADGANEPPSRTRRRDASDAGARRLRDAISAAVGPEWQARLDLDRARLAFYDTAPSRRAELLKEHAARRAALEAQEGDEQRRAREADAEHARALEAARANRSETERAIAAEQAHLADVASDLAKLREKLDASRKALAAQRDLARGWGRRIRDAEIAGPAEADTAYDALRGALRDARDQLSGALDMLDRGTSEVPVLGPEQRQSLPTDAGAELLFEQRAVLARTLAETRADEAAQREELAAAALDTIDTLNHDRLLLLPYLSSAKRDAITGFTPEGWEQARSEVRHLSLILRYHRHVGSSWLETLRSGNASVVSPWRTTAALVPILLASAAFIWARRRTPNLLRMLEARLAADDRAARRTTPSPARRFVRTLAKLHRPIEGLFFFVILLGLLPREARDLLEVQLFASIVGWVLAGSLIVNGINAIAAGSSLTFLSLGEDETGELRLRSLRLVGRTVVVFALILVLSARLVGEGTIYSWVFSTCWLAAVPIFVVLVRWWRDVVFDRLDRARKKRPIEAWVLANRVGWKSSIAAMIGALHMFGAGAVKLARNWFSGFDVVRRAHAYVFKRGIERIEENAAGARFGPLPEPALAALHPERPFDRWIACPADTALADLTRRTSDGGGMFVVIAPRGMGKTSLLRAVAAATGGTAVIVNCSARTTIDDVREAAGLRAGSSAARLVMLDDIHTLIEPRIGGLHAIDAITTLARAHSDTTAWVFAIEASVWPLLRRARDARPMFDATYVLQPWSETELGALLADRNATASITPAYDDLLERLPPGADELDRQDALRAKRAGYERMLWDHVGGNPGLALEVWRTSLAEGPKNTVRVRALQVPDASPLEALPDTSLFILRAVIQLAPATVEAVAQSTRLRPEEVLQDIRYGKTQGFLEDHDGGVRVSWSWLRPVTRHLQRRHMLGTS